MTPFVYRLRVRYPECDGQKIAFNANYGLWTDLATTELARALDPACLGEGGGFDYRVRAQSTEWLAPAAFDAVLDLCPVVEHVGETSFRVRTEIRRWPEGAPVARVVTTYVLVDPVAGTKRVVGDALRARLLHGAPGRVTDHAHAGEGRVTSVVTPSERRSMPWRNGGGVTHELWKEGEGSCGFALRLSIAEVGEDGPFSRFPGVDRTISLLDGAGFTLTRSDGVVVAFRAPGVPFAFAGEDAWDCALTDGAVRDFNVMVDRATLRAWSRATPAGWVDGRFALALADGRIGDVDVRAGTLVEVDGRVPTTMATIQVYVEPVSR